MLRIFNRLLSTILPENIVYSRIHFVLSSSWVFYVFSLYHAKNDFTLRFCKEFFLISIHFSFARFSSNSKNIKIIYIFEFKLHFSPFRWRMESCKKRFLSQTQKKNPLNIQFLNNSPFPN